MSKPRDLTQFCNISHWIEKNDPELADAIKHLCMGNVFQLSNLALIYPTDKAIVKKIVDKVYSKNGSDFTEAIDIIESMFIPHRATTALDFKTGVSNRRGRKIEIDVGGTTSTEVKLKNGGTMTLATNFKQAPQRKASGNWNPRDRNYAVWMLKGAIPDDGPEFTPSVVKKGGAQVAHQNASQRKLLAERLEKEFHTGMLAKNHKNPYTLKMVSLLNYLELRQPDVLTKIHPILDRNSIVSFYLLVEPYKTHAPYLIEDDILFGSEGWQETPLYTEPNSEFLAFFDTSPDPSATYANNPTSIQGIKTKLGQLLIGKASIVTPKHLLDTYKMFIKENKLGSIANVLPASTIRAISAEQKLWQDEFRFTFHINFYEIAKSYEGSWFLNMINDIRTLWPGNDYAKEMQFTNANEHIADLNNQERFRILMKFINSSDFLYTPIPSSLVPSANNSTSDYVDPRLALSTHGGGMFANFLNNETTKRQFTKAFTSTANHVASFACGLHTDYLQKKKA